MKLISPEVRSFITLAIICGAFAIAVAQNEKPAPTPMQKPATNETPAPPAANPADANSIDAIIAAVYDVISGPAGKKRDWDRMRSLFVPGARLIPTGPRQTGGYGSRVLTVDEYIERASASSRRKGFLSGRPRAEPKRLARLRMSSALMNRATHRMTRNRFNAALTAFS
ncbi:MAG: hypothetical protein M3R69_06365 [Acidobacteriota bacterium]|nr:hypothetical protein [Acidobacteriota bacterium]